MRKFLVLAMAALALLTGIALPVAARGTPYCGIRWGSLPKQDSHYTSASITNLRAGRHACFDRLVIDLGPRTPGWPGPDANGYQVRYASQFTSDPSNRPIALAGGADLSILLHPRALDHNRTPTDRPADPRHALQLARVSPHPHVVFDGTFEGQTQIGLGVRARLPFRVFSLAGPGGGTRLVVDVAHRW